MGRLATGIFGDYERSPLQREDFCKEFMRCHPRGELLWQYLLSTCERGGHSSHVVEQSCAMPHALFPAGDLTAAGARKHLIGTDGETEPPMGGRSCYLHIKSCR